MAHNSTGSLLSATTQALEKVVLAPGEDYSNIFYSIEEPIYLQAYGLTGDPDTDYIALEAVLVSPYGNTYVDYAPAGPVRFHRLTNHCILRERGAWRLRREGNSDAFVKLMVGSNIHEMPDSYWADRYNVGREGGVTSVTGQNTPSVSLTALPTTGAVSVFANVNISPDAGNTVSIKPNGVYGRGPLNGDIINVPTTVSDSATVDHTLSSNNLTSSVKLSADAGNVVEARADGLFVPAAAAAPIQSVTGSSSTTWLHNVSTSSGAVTVSGSVRFSPASGNQASDDGQGVWVPRGAGLGLDTSGVQTNSFTPDVTLTSGVLKVKGDVRVSATAGNQVSIASDGLLVPVNVASLTVSDTDSIDLTQNATTGAVTLSAAAKISSQAGNVITVNTSPNAGLFVPTPVSSLALNDTNSIDFTSSGTTGSVTASANVKISPDSGNIIEIRTGGSAGIYATAAGTVNATRVATGITRFCEESQMRDATAESALVGGYTVTTASLVHFVHCNRADSPTALNCARVGLPGFSPNDPNVFGSYFGNGAFSSSQAYGRSGGVSSNVVVCTRDGLIGSDANNTILVGGRVDGAAVNNSVSVGLRYESAGIGLHLSDSCSVGDLAVDGDGVIGDFNECSFLGRNGAILHSLGSAISVSYGSLNTSNGAWPVSSHGLTTGQYHVCVANTSGGNKGIVVWAADANNLIALGQNLTTYSGTTTLRKVARITNSTSIGFGAVISENNQIKLGNDSVTKVTSNANCIFEGDVFVDISDERLKKDIVEINSVGDVFDTIRPSSYTRIDSGKQTIGFVAQNVESVVPKAVTECFDGMLGLNTTALLAVMWAEVKSLRKRVAELESR